MNSTNKGGDTRGNFHVLSVSVYSMILCYLNITLLQHDEQSKLYTTVSFVFSYYTKLI